MSEQHQDLNGNPREAWERNAVFWDARYGEGNAFQRCLLEPALLRLLEIESGQRILEIACGNGAFARRMAALGCQVLACDFSKAFLECARARTTSCEDRIAYRWLDATDQVQLEGLASNGYDAVVCNMALMDLSDIVPLLHAVPRLLREGGRFCFSVMHPCFNSTAPGNSLLLEEADIEGEIVVTRSVRMSRYLTPCHTLGLGMIGQPVPQHYFHRPLSVLLNAAFQVGLVLDALEEPAFQEAHPEERALSWGNLHEIPPVLICRLRPMP